MPTWLPVLRSNLYGLVIRWRKFDYKEIRSRLVKEGGHPGTAVTEADAPRDDSNVMGLTGVSS